MSRAYPILILCIAASSVAAEELVPGPAPAQVDALEQSGRRYKMIGAVLIGTGGAVALIGTGLWIGGEASSPCMTHTENGCNWSAAAIAGASTALVGTGVIVSGVVLYVIGGRKIDRAHHLR